MEFKNLLCLLLAIATQLACGKKIRDLETVFQWTLLDYGFPTQEDYAQAVRDGNLVPENGIPIDVQPNYLLNGELRVFTTIPRFQTGIPYTLATISGFTGPGGPTLQPYPNYQWHTSHGRNCDGITSAFRVAVNECNQMWVIDSGLVGSDYKCPPQLLLFDLVTDELVHRYRFNASIFTPSASLFITPVINVRDPPPIGHCRQTMVYVADVTNHGIIIYDYNRDVAWRSENKFMYPDPDFGTHTIAGESFTLMDGVIGMATDGTNLYFHPMATTDEYAVPLRVLNDQARWTGQTDAGSNDFQSLGSRGSECAAEAIDRRGNFYCVNFNPIKLVTWKVNSRLKAHNYRQIAADPKKLEFVSGMKVALNPFGQEELWMISNRFQKIAAGTQNKNEINFRIVRRTLDDMQNDAFHPQRPFTDLHNKLIFN